MATLAVFTPTFMSTSEEVKVEVLAAEGNQYLRRATPLAEQQAGVVGAIVNLRRPGTDGLVAL